METNSQIRELNDVFRTTLLGAGRVYLTAGIASRSATVQSEIMKMVVEFNDFTPENDPYGEHDFGSFNFAGECIFWKIDYYDLDMYHGSPDPSDPAVTTRILTVMLAQEY